MFLVAASLIKYNCDHAKTSAKFDDLKQRHGVLNGKLKIMSSTTDALVEELWNTHLEQAAQNLQITQVTNFEPFDFIKKEQVEEHEEEFGSSW